MPPAGREYDEKRDYRRMVVDCEVQYRNLSTGETGIGQGKDLSAKGILFISAQPIKAGTELEIQIEPDRALVPPLHAVVDVVRSSEGGPGCFLIGASIREICS